MLLDDVLYAIDSDTRPHWEATKNKELLIQFCPSCKTHQFYPRVICKNCFSDVEWVPASGKATVYSYSVVHKVFNLEFKEKLPYILALVELEEGPRMMTNIIECELDQVKIGMPVQADFSQIFGEYNLVRFKPA
ncbi:Zn-ribbon domain-containing OB-fold protein [Bacillus sp. B15-48]|uniref:Zn-ribbon domain-containing OB-fold protein n=1 Tax=Bacillus sp. B15-48 TaxID=1548601 RepID=UPI00193FEEC0|nr:Zn-ribbon domain-containing OB-fold protein [Bacillus sp. B15-48]